MSVLDTHVHVWDAGVLDYPWLHTSSALDSRYLPAQVDRADGQTTRMIFVEADAAPARALDEARWVARLGWPERAGIVAHADLTSATLTDDVDALQSVGAVVGVRDLLQSTPVEQWRAPERAEGLAELARRGLTFDACIRHAQLPALAEFLERAEAASVVLDHLGKPPVDAGLDSAEGRAWHDGIRRLADLPHVHVKLSGLAAESTDAAAYDRHADGFIAAAAEAFGPHRLMIGSDWPVSARMGVGTTFADWVARIRRVTGAEGAEWAALSEGNGRAFYRLG